MVLIVYDEADIRWLLMELLLGEDIPARAVGPQEAIGALHELHPEVLLLDVGMPEVNGYEVLRYLRADPVLCTTHVIIVTGMAQPEDITAGLNGGADDYLTKLFATEELIARVRRGLKDAGKRRRKSDPMALPDNFWTL